MRIKNIFKWKKNWINSKINNIIFLIILIKKKKIKNIIINFVIKSKNIFYYKFSIIIKKIKNIIMENLKILKINKKNIKKLKIIKIISKNNIIEYKMAMNNRIESFKIIFLLIENKFSIWKKENEKFLLIIILIAINIIKLNIKIWKNKKIKINYKICGKIFKIINIINIQQLEYLIEWVTKSHYIKEKLYLQNIKRKRKTIINI